MAMAKKYYVVFKGRRPGIYTDWETTKQQVNRYKNATYKSFLSFSEAKAWLEHNIRRDKRFGIHVSGWAIAALKMQDPYDKDNPYYKPKQSKHKEIENPGLGNDLTGTQVSLYTDGSYDESTSRYAWSYVLENENLGVIAFNSGSAHADDDNMWQVSGEIDGVKLGIAKAQELGYGSVNVKYDLINLQKWGDDEWKANKQATKDYKDTIRQFRRLGVSITFTKVKAHSGSMFNEMCDFLAKQALGIKKYDNMDAIPEEYLDLIKEV